jgi:hypothetical protein
VTWVVGTGVMFGYAFGVSDVRVTLEDKTEHDCLQKIYPVGRYMAAAFSGSVEIGFGMIKKLSELLLIPEGQPGVWDPGAVANWWPIDAKEVFAAYPESERRNKANLMLLGVNPNEHNGSPAWPRAEVYVFKSPDFEPVKGKPHQLLTIGYGAGISEFQTALTGMSEDNTIRTSLMQGEVGTIGGMGTHLAMRLTKMLQEHQPQWISSHLHLCWVFPGRIQIRTNNHVQNGRWSSWGLGPDNQTSDEETNFKMSRIAQNLDELGSSYGKKGILLPVQ